MTRAGRPAVVHLTTTDMSLDWLLRPQLEAFDAAGYEVITMSAPGPHVAALEASGLRHVAVENLSRSMRPTGDLRAGRELWQQLRRLRPDIVHTHNPKPGVIGRPIARLAGSLVVNTVHGLYAQTTDPLRRRLAVYSLERFAAAFSHAELVQSIEDVDTLRRLRVPARRVTLLGNGIDLARFDPARHGPSRIDRSAARAALGLGADEIACGIVGRLVWEKGYREVFAAARILARSEPRIRIVIVGPAEPDKAGAVDQTAIDAAEADGVIFLGQRDDVDALYAAFDLYALASHREGFPRSAMEAAAMGLPIVATDIRGCRQVVDDGHTGRLVPTGDADALAAAIAEIATDDTRRRSMGAAARAKALAEFDQQEVIDITLETYEALLATRPR